MTPAQAYDARLLEDARDMCNLNTTAEIRGYLAATGRELDPADNAYAALCGRLQAVTSQLVRMVERNA